MRDIYSARYMLFMMGSMGVYAGLVYNDYFSLGLNLFGSNYEFLSEESGSKVPMHCPTVCVCVYVLCIVRSSVCLYLIIPLLIPHSSLIPYYTYSLNDSPLLPPPRPLPLTPYRPYCSARTVTPSACTLSVPIPCGKYQPTSFFSSTR